MNESPIYQLVGLGSILATVVSLVVWVVKMSFQRQAAITDRYFGHLEETGRQTAETNRTLAGAFDELRHAMKRLEERSDEKIKLLQQLTQEVRNGKCRAKDDGGA